MRALMAVLLLAALMAGCTNPDEPSTGTGTATGTDPADPTGTGASGTQGTATTAPSSGTSTTGTTSRPASSTSGTSTSGTNSTSPGGNNNQTVKPAPPAAVTQECTLSGGGSVNVPRGCTLAEFVSSTGASFTKGTATATYTGAVVPTGNFAMYDVAGNELASTSGALPLTVSLDGKVPEGASVTLNGAVWGTLLVGASGKITVTLS